MGVDELTADRLADFVTAIDRVFVAERGRTGSVANRWPALFRPGGARCFTITVEGEAVSGLVARPIACVLGGRHFTAHQIGFVFTLPAWRGRGLAAKLLRAVDEQVAGPLVLWTTRPDFYAPHGWEAWDPGGAKALWHGSASETGAPALPLTPEMLPTLDTIRAASLMQRIKRASLDWQARPFGAERMQVALAPGGYALFSQNHDTAILYEMVGDPSQFPALWPAVVRGCGSALLNLDADTPAARWLSGTPGVMAQPNPLAMWRRWPIAERWCLDWLDRI